MAAGALMSTVAAQTPARPTAAATPQRKTAAPITWQQVEKDYAAEFDRALKANLTARGIEFADPETLEALVGRYERTDKRLAIRDALKELMPGPPDVPSVEREAPSILANLRTAVQKRNDAEVERLVHPAIRRNKDRIYQLFADEGPEAVGKVTAAPNDRIAAQFFRLITKSGVETLYYVQFALLDKSDKRIVVRDVVSGPAVDALFLEQEQAIAVSKLQAVFRALSAKDTAALQDLVTPGLFDLVKDVPAALAGGLASEKQLSMTPSVSRADNSIRPVVRVSYTTRSNKKVDFDIDFERINGDLKVVRLRDATGAVIALDPDIFNYVRRRYKQPDGPRPTDLAFSAEPCFQPLSKIEALGMSAIFTRDPARIREYADCVIDFLPQLGYSLRASAQQLTGNFPAALDDARRGIEAGGTVYFPLKHHVPPSIGRAADWLKGGVPQDIFYPVLLAVSSKGLQYRPFPGQEPPGQVNLDIPIANLQAVHLDKNMSGARPYLTLKFRHPADKDEKTYNFAAFDTHCPIAGVPAPKTAAAMMVDHKNAQCYVNQATKQQVVARVPSTWSNEVSNVLFAIQAAAPALAKGSK